MRKIDLEKVSSDCHVYESNRYEYNETRLHQLLALVREWLSAVWLTLRYIEPFALCVVGAWLYICMALGVPNPFRAIMIWGLIFLLVTGVAIVNPKARC